MSDIGDTIFEKKYAKTFNNGKKETWEQCSARVGTYVASAEVDESKKLQCSSDFTKIIADKVFIPGGRTLANAGTGIKNLLNCFVMPIEDSRQSIYNTLKNAAEIFAWGGGIGYNFSKIREEGSPVVTTGGKASGPVSFMELFDTTGEVISQASRRGAQIGILNVNHPDILKFIQHKHKLTAKNQRIYDEFFRLVDTKEINAYYLEKVLSENQLTHFNISVGMTNSFMKTITENNIDSQIEIFDVIAKNAWENGDPGLYFIDIANEFSLVPYLGSLDATNPCGEIPLLPYEACIHKESLINTQDGLKKIINVAPGDKVISKTERGNWVFTTVLKNLYRGKKEIFELCLNNGQSIKATKDHKILTSSGWKDIEKINLGDKVSILTNGSLRKESIIQKELNCFDMFGWMTGDGWFMDKSCGLVFGYDDLPIMETLVNEFRNFCDSNYKITTQKTEGYRDRYQVGSFKNSVLRKFEILGFIPAKAIYKTVPESILFSKVSEEKLRFLRGLFSSDGCITKNGSGKYTKIVLASSSKPLLKQVQIILLEFGIQSYVEWFTPEGKNPQGQLYISGKSALLYMDMIGFLLDYKANKFEIPERIHNNIFYTVVSITPLGIDDVYDLALDSVHNFIANGIIVHNCCLGSLNLPMFVEGRYIDYPYLREVIKYAVRFLDNIQTINQTPVEEINISTKRTRRLGLGIMGFADMLAEMQISYNSSDAINLIDDLAKFIQITSWKESMNLAEEKGAFPAFDSEKINWKIIDSLGLERKPLRNVAITSIAPTGTIALLADVNSGIEPFFSKKYIRNVTSGVGNVAEAVFNTNINYENILTAHEIDWKDHINIQSAWQKYIDNAVSKTINMHESSTVKDIKDAFIYAWEKGCKGITVYRNNSRSFQILNAT